MYFVNFRAFFCSVFELMRMLLIKAYFYCYYYHKDI